MFRNKIFLFFVGIIAAAGIATSCKDKNNEDITTAVNKNGAIETSVTTETADSTHDVLVTKHIVWLHGTTFKEVVYRDTIPSLGMQTTKAENSSGDTKQVNVKKDYEIFITVK